MGWANFDLRAISGFLRIIEWPHCICITNEALIAFKQFILNWHSVLHGSIAYMVQTIYIYNFLHKMIHSEVM